MNPLTLTLRAISETPSLMRERVSTELSSRLQMISIFALAIITACLSVYAYSTFHTKYRLNFKVSKLKYALAQHKPMQIFVKTVTGKTITLDVHKQEKISSLKGKIQDIENIVPALQEIIFTGQTLADDKTITDYNIQKNSTLHLIVKNKKSIFSIFVQTLGSPLVRKTFHLKVQNDQTISSLKKELFRKEGIAPDTQKLVFAGTTLLDHKMIKDYKIEKECTLFLT